MWFIQKYNILLLKKLRSLTILRDTRQYVRSLQVSLYLQKKNSDRQYVDFFNLSFPLLRFFNQFHKIIESPEQALIKLNKHKIFKLHKLCSPCISKSKSSDLLANRAFHSHFQTSPNVTLHYTFHFISSFQRPLLLANCEHKVVQ